MQQCSGLLTLTCPRGTGSGGAGLSAAGLRWVIGSHGTAL